MRPALFAALLAVPILAAGYAAAADIPEPPANPHRLPPPPPPPGMSAPRTPPASARPSGRAICKDRAEIIKILGQKFGETQQSFGLQNDSRVLELYASPSGSWTAILTLPSGKSCVVASGEAWTVLPPGEPT